MAKSTNQKLKLLYLMQIMLENTDDEHVHILSGFLIKARRFETDTIYSAHIQSDKEVEGKGADVEVGCE